MKNRIITVLAVVFTAAVLLSGCSSDDAGSPAADNTKESTISENTGKAAEDQEATGKTEESADQETAAMTPDDQEAGKQAEEVDLILFMGQSNMSGAAGDAALAPYVSPDAGEEFRAVSDPTKLYPITEPFGVNENNPSGLYEYPGAKKGSLVSAFVNRYHELTGRKVIAVSISMGATDMSRWMLPGVTDDVTARFNTAKSFLNDNGYKIGHMYALWLHGESDAIEGTDPEVYKSNLDTIMRPLFIGGLQKVFLIMPGRTIDYRDIFLKIIDVQKQICRESGYYAIATTILTKVSTEFMRDQYHYNQHVLNLVGMRSADSVAYYTKNNEEMIVYDYREGGYIYPEDATADDEESGDEGSGDGKTGDEKVEEADKDRMEDPLDLTDLNIDDIY
ncbi:MAG: hypothetical protein IKO16_09585 [Lachnospiraceae bacterium]|nr:hypothetical protein [Lachnospiraceae bacterium]